MKRLLLTILTVIFALSPVFAQDIITTKEGKDIKAKLLEVNPDNVKYVMYDDEIGPVFTLNKTDILMITYANGEREVIKDKSPVSATVPLKASASVTRGMKYNEYKDLYDVHDYVPDIYDPYSRGWAGVASLIVPGLGQGICDEWGRAVAFIGANVACNVLSLVFAEKTKETEGSTTTTVFKYTGASYAFLAASLAINIWSVIDAVHVAKIKNMYNQDIRRQNAGLNIDMYPYLAMTPSTPGNNANPVAGLSLKLSF